MNYIKSPQKGRLPHSYHIQISKQAQSIIGSFPVLQSIKEFSEMLSQLLHLIRVNALFGEADRFAAGWMGPLTHQLLQAFLRIDSPEKHMPDEMLGLRASDPLQFLVHELGPAITGCPLYSGEPEVQQKYVDEKRRPMMKDRDWTQLQRHEIQASVLLKQAVAKIAQTSDRRICPSNVSEHIEKHMSPTESETAKHGEQPIRDQKVEGGKGAKMKMKMQLGENDEQMISEPWMDGTWEHMEHSEPDESMGGYMVRTVEIAMKGQNE
ncbi:hypothetical protein B0H13DRAFT_1897129 [Mycena leptocephala]|nr:hypothetical protein B0H13DRAFT_1897129 [Mycena leptocephala]